MKNKWYIGEGYNGGLTTLEACVILGIIIYIIMNLGLFSCLLMMKRNNEYFESLEDLSGLSKNHPVLSFSLLIILYIFGKSGDFNYYLPVISMYIFAGYRLMPALHHIYLSFSL